MNKTIKLAADIGGTFTDIVLEAGNERWSGKVLTTTRPRNWASSKVLALFSNNRE